MSHTPFYGPDHSHPRRSQNQPGEGVHSLAEIAAIIDSHEDWWRFPEENPVRGFWGVDPLILVGDQPSTSEWPSSHPNRRAFYDRLPKVGAANAHITDLYKRRGKAGALRQGVPEDFDLHLELFRAELALLKPTRVVALGHHAETLLKRHVPEVRSIMTRMWHFAYVVRYGKISAYENNMRASLKGWKRPSITTLGDGSR